MITAAPTFLADPTFLDTLSPATRKVLVAERVAAMRGRVREVCDRLKDIVAATASDSPSDIAALGMLWSEVLHLNGEDGNALLIFKKFVEPQRASLPIPAQLVASDNLTVLQMEESLDEAVSTFYHLADRRRLVQFDTTDNQTLLAAQSAIEQNKFAEALPLLWQNLLRAYALGGWRAIKRAAERIAKLYLKVGALEQACHYLIVAEAEKEVEHLAAATTSRGDPTVIDSIIRRLMEFANLRRHFIIACKFVERISDIIPDDKVESLATWLLPRCREPASHNGGGAMRAAWEAVRELGHRLAPDTSQRLIEAALSHSEWQAPLPGEDRVLVHREVLAKSVMFLSHSAPKDYLPAIVEGTLPLATERVQNFDYGTVVNLLCNLRELGGDTIRNRIKAALYVPEKPLNRILAQVARHFGAEAFNPTQWEAFASRVVEETRNTVQRLRPGEVAKPVGETLMTMTQETPRGQLQVAIHGGVGLQALVRAKSHLYDATIERIVRVLIEMAMHRDNLLSNREALLAHLCDFADRAQPGLRDEVVRTLEPMARGSVLESADYQTSEAERHPLASANLNMGTPQQVQAMALVAAATFCGSDANRFRLIGDALAEGFVSPHVAVRKGAYAAARRLPELSSEQLLPILMGLRDPDPEAAIAAFAAFAEQIEWPLTRPMWKLFLLATRLASQSPNPKLRRHASLALRARLANAPTQGIRDESQAIVDAFSIDVSYSVRETIDD